MPRIEHRSHEYVCDVCGLATEMNATDGSELPIPVGLDDREMIWIVCNYCLRAAVKMYWPVISSQTMMRSFLRLREDYHLGPPHNVAYSAPKPIENSIRILSELRQFGEINQDVHAPGLPAENLWHIPWNNLAEGDDNAA